MRLLALLLALAALPALAGDAPPPPPPPPPPSGDVSTAPVDQPPPPPSSQPAAEVKGPRTNWARTGALIGFIAAGVVLALNLVNELFGAGLHGNASEPEAGPDTAVQLLPIAVTAVAGPVTYAGGNSARWTKSITGSRGLRITGWIGYGVGLFFELIGLVYIPGVRILGGIVGAGALVCHGVDALYSAGEAADVESMSSADDADDGLKVRPVVSLLPAFGGRGGGATFGLVGAF